MPNTQDRPDVSTRLLEIAPDLVRDALRIKEGQIVEVTLTGERQYLSILDEVTLAISQAGAYPVIRLNTPSYRRRFVQTVPEKYLMQPPPHMVKWIADIDRHINLVADAPRFNPIHISEKRRQVHQDAQKKITGKIKQKNITAIFIPTRELADYCGTTVDRLETFLLNGLDVNYPALRRSCRSLTDQFRGRDKKISLISGDNLMLSCKLGERQVHIEDGRHELPGGMIFFSPVEATVNGQVMIHQYIAEGGVVRKLLLEFRDGKLVRSEAEDNHRLFSEILKNSYGDADVFAGIGLGMNTGITDRIGSELFDFYALGTIHISLGSNLIYGGTNFSDLFTRMEVDHPVVMVDDVVVSALTR